MKRSQGIDGYLLLIWCLILVGQGVDRSSGPFGAFPEPPPPSHRPSAPREGHSPLHPQFTPVAVVVPPIGTPPGNVVTLPAPTLPGAFGQTQSSFSPPPPAAVTVGPPPVLLIPTTPLGQGSAIFAAPAPPLQLVPIAGAAPQASPGAGIPFFVPFAQGPTAIINQFIQPPLVPFGQVGVQSGSYLPGFFSGNANPFSRTCNYYYFQGCGPSGGAVTDFNFSTR